MANSKISALTAATTPLAGTETLPVVQSSTTKQVSVANLTAGRAVSAASLSLTTTPLAVSSGGTGLSSFTANTIPYASGTTTLASGTALQFNGKIIGLSQTPSAWASNYTGLQGQESYGAFLSDNGNGFSETVSNAYNDGTWKYKNSSIGAVRVVGDSVGKAVKIYTAPAGTADTAITWTLRFTVSDTAVTFNADNLVQGTAAKGINFTANTGAAGMTSQLLNWYEEGTWTPTFGNLTVIGTPTYTGKYTRIGRQVTFTLRVQSTTTTQSGFGATFFNLPIGTPANPSTLTAVQSLAGATYGVGLIYTDGNGYPPTWAANADVTISGMYFV